MQREIVPGTKHLDYLSHIFLSFPQIKILRKCVCVCVRERERERERLTD